MCLGLGNSYVPEKKESVKTTSLLKRKTNNDRINEMSIEEKAEFLTRKTKCIFCDDEVMREQTDCRSLKACTEYCKWKQWLESEAEE